ncbi:MAG: hypothetical protein PHD67_08055 [Oscillospiraceae bacterium]|nr:hypothetical protein [Oscillospiraceae bacterium]
MTKGKFGLSLAAVAVIAFGFAALRQPQSVLLVAGFALLAEKDEWLNRQAMQALLLTITYYLAELATGWVFGGLARFFGWVKLYGAAGAMSTVNSFVDDVLYLALIAFSVLAVVRVLRGKDAGLPWLSKLAGGDFAAAIKPKTRTAAESTQTAPPVQAAPAGAQYAPSAQPQASFQTLSAVTQDAPAPAVRLCPACSAPLHEDSRFCTECGAKAE